jgi:Mg2+ and Co2+ transporter CorA
MGEVVEGLGPSERQRIAALRRAGTFFWADASFAETSGDDLGGPWTFPAPYSAGSSTFARTPPSRKFHSDGERVVFDFSCFLELAELAPRTPGPLRPIEVHVLISGDYLLTVHEERVSLPGLLSPDLPEGRSEQYVVYSILDAMVATGFDALNEAELTLEGLQLMSTDMRASRVRMATLRAINSRLSRMRRRLGPQRGIFERVSEEIGRIKGLEADSDRYFERI